jgi:hypothetical protein
MFIQVLHKGIPQDVQATGPGTVWFVRLVDPQILRPYVRASNEMSGLQGFEKEFAKPKFSPQARPVAHLLF